MQMQIQIQMEIQMQLQLQLPHMEIEVEMVGKVEKEEKGKCNLCQRQSESCLTSAK